MEKKVIVVGGGAAGLMAAGQAAAQGAQVVLLEKRERLGSKIALSGKGRCNISNAGDIEDFISFYPGNGKFLYSALRALDNEALRSFLGQRGVRTKVERGGRIFPESDRAETVVEALSGFVREAGVRVHCSWTVSRLEVAAPEVAAPEMARAEVPGRKDAALPWIKGVWARQNGGAEVFWPAAAVIIAVGGASYPGTGSTGDGVALAQASGHAVMPLLPALVPLRTAETWPAEAQGLSLRNVKLTLFIEGVKKGEGFGEMIFTHFGVSGPLVLTLSGMAVQALSRGQKVALHLNLKPALSPEQLLARLERDWAKFGAKHFKNALTDLLPKSLIPVIVRLSGIAPEKSAKQITPAENRRLAALLQALPLTVTSSLGLAAAIVTAGGVQTREIVPQTMASKRVRGLYWAGEVIDIDGVTGGYNLQAAFSTGYVAGRAAAAFAQGISEN